MTYDLLRWRIFRNKLPPAIFDQDGASLTEQMVSLVIGSVMILTLYGYFRSEVFQTLKVELKTGTLEDARGALDIMTRDFKNAGSWGTGGAPPEQGGADDPDNDGDTVCNRVYTAGVGVLHIQMDLNGNGNCSDTDPRENIRYDLAGPTSTCPGPYIIRRNGDCLVSNVVPPAGQRIFTFFDANGVSLGGSPAREAIKRVRIEFAVQSKNPDPRSPGSVTSAVSSSIEFRN